MASAEEVLEEMLKRASELSSVSAELSDNFRGLLKAAGGSTSATDRQTTAAIKNASSFSALETAVQGSTEEQNRYTNNVTAAKLVWNTMTGAVSDAASVLGQMTNDLLGGEGFGTFKAMIDPIADVIESIGTVAGKLVGGFLKLGSNLIGVGSAFEVAGTLAEGAGEALGKITAAAFKFVATIALDATEQLWSMFEGAASSGLLVTNGLKEMKSQMTSLKLTTKEYTSLIKNQAQNMTIFGGTVAEGAKKLAAVSAANSQHEQLIRRLGITYQEQAEMTSDFMESLARTGHLRALSDTQIADASFSYMQNLTVITALTGKSIDEMKKDRDEMLKNLAIQAKLSRLDPKAREQMELAMAALPKGVEKTVMDTIMFGHTLTDTATILTGANIPIEKFINSVMDGSVNFEQGFQTFRNELKEAGPAIRDSLVGLEGAGMAAWMGKGGEVAQNLNASSATLFQMVRNVEEGTAFDVANAKAAAEGADEGVKSIVNMMNTQRELMQKILTETQERLPVIAAALDAIMSTAGSLIDKLGEESEEGGAIDSGIKTISSMAESVKETVTKAMNAGLKAFESMSDMIADIVGSKTYKMLFGRDTKEQDWFPDKSPEAITKKDIRIAEMKESPEKTMEQIESAQAKIYDIEGQEKRSGGKTRAEMAAMFGDDAYTGTTREQETDALLKLIKLLEDKAITDSNNAKESIDEQKKANVIAKGAAGEAATAAKLLIDSVN